MGVGLSVATTVGNSGSAVVNANSRARGFAFSALSAIGSAAYFVGALFIGALVTMLMRFWETSKLGAHVFFKSVTNLSQQANVSASIANLVGGKNNPFIWILAYLLVRTPLLAIYIVVRLVNSILKRIVPLFLFLFFTLIMLFFEAQSLYMVEYSHQAVSMGVHATNIGAAAANVFLEVSEWIHPIVMESVMFTVQSTMLVVNNIPDSNSRRMLETAGFAGLALGGIRKKVVPKIIAWAKFIGIGRKIQLIYYTLLILIFGYLFINFGSFILEVVENAASVVTCAMANIRCFLLERIDGLIAAPLRFLGVSIEIRCDRDELTGGHVDQDEYMTSCYCAAWFSNLPACIPKRVLCAYSADAFCESVNGYVLGCHQESATLGCPLSHRSLDTIGLLHKVALR
jgi:hypothetical protein